MKLAAWWRGAGVVRLALALIVGLTIARFVLAALIPLSFDEAYYWRWSTHLALGYFDHPPLIAWAIRLGTLLFGDTEFGVRFVPLLAGVAASWAVWRAAGLLLGDRRLAATAALYFNLMLILSVGTILATPDALLLGAAVLLLLCLATAVRNGRAGWWLAAGVAVGIGCLAKYTALLWLPSILIWLLLDRTMRRSLATPWPYAGAFVAFLLFLPNLVWNATHDWLTFAKQFGRVAADGLEPRFVLEHLGAEIGMATPVIFVLGWLGLAAFLSRRGGERTTRNLIGSLVWPTAIYFIVHSLHARVEGNWTGPIFPALAIAAAAAGTMDWRGWVRRLVSGLRRLAAPVGLALVIVVYSETLFGWLPFGADDPTAGKIGVGMAAAATEIEAVRVEAGAGVILTTDYHLTGWLSFYEPEQPAPVLQVTELERWIQEPLLDPRLLSGPLLLLVPGGGSAAAIGAELGTATLIRSVARRRGETIVAVYDLYLIERRAFAAASP